MVAGCGGQPRDTADSLRLRWHQQPRARTAPGSDSMNVRKAEHFIADTELQFCPLQKSMKTGLRGVRFADCRR